MRDSLEKAGYDRSACSSLVNYPPPSYMCGAEPQDKSWDCCGLFCVTSFILIFTASMEVWILFFLMLKFREFILKAGKPYCEAVIHMAENDLLHAVGAVVAQPGLRELRCLQRSAGHARPSLPCKKKL